MLTRTALRTLEGAGHLVGPERARALAAAAWRRRGTSDAAFFKLAHRVSRRLRDQNPALFKIPDEWTSRSPVVEVERLGLTLELDLRDNLQALLFFGGTYEPAVLQFLEDDLDRGDVFVDVGAHIGVHSLLAARRLAAGGGGRVIAFEPAGDSAAKLLAAAARNGLAVDVVQVALGAGTGDATLFADENYDPHDAGVRSQYGSGRVVEQVPVVAFDDWADEEGLERVDVVKIDVEGAEPFVIAGMRRALSAHRPRAVLVEAKGHGSDRAGTGGAGLDEALAALGYEDQGVDLNRNRLFRPRL